MVNYCLVSSTLLARKASKLVFTADASHVVLADKNGDVYKIKTTQQEIEVEDTKEVKEVTKDQLGNRIILKNIKTEYIGECYRYWGVGTYQYGD